MLSCSIWFYCTDYVPEAHRPKNTSIKLPSCVKLAFHFISLGRCAVKQPSSYPYVALHALLTTRELK